LRNTLSFLALSLVILSGTTYAESNFTLGVSGVADLYSISERNRYSASSTDGSSANLRVEVFFEFPSPISDRIHLSIGYSRAEIKDPYALVNSTGSNSTTDNLTFGGGLVWKILSFEDKFVLRSGVDGRYSILFPPSWYVKSSSVEVGNGFNAQLTIPLQFDFKLSEMVSLFLKQDIVGAEMSWNGFDNAHTYTYSSYEFYFLSFRPELGFGINF